MCGARWRERGGGVGYTFPERFRVSAVAAMSEMGGGDQAVCLPEEGKGAAAAMAGVMTGAEWEQSGNGDGARTERRGSGSGSEVEGQPAGGGSDACERAETDKRNRIKEICRRAGHDESGVVVCGWCDVRVGLQEGARGKTRLPNISSNRKPSLRSVRVGSSLPLLAIFILIK